MRQTTQAIPLDVIIRAIFGVEDPERVPVYRRAVIEYIDAFSPLLLFSPVSVGSSAASVPGIGSRGP